MAEEKIVPFPAQDPWERMEGMAEEELAEFLAELLGQRQEMDAAEPDEADEEAYETWADAHEELEDLIDEVRDRLEE
ncbi:MAG: hypothetical protein SO100_00725 [Dysosmobacter sp.]|nr:hypothetical protein [Dysosmobacter sp.]